MVKNTVRLEGLAVFLASLYFYFQVAGDFTFLFVLILAPDISMIGYLFNKNWGSITYNMMHNYILAVLLLFSGIILESNFPLALGFILSAHVGMDRALGFGLKYPTRFKDTHIQKL